MFCTVNEHLDKEEGIQCLKANCAFKQLSILSFCFVHTFSPQTLCTSPLIPCFYILSSALTGRTLLCSSAQLSSLWNFTRGLVVFWPFIHLIFSSLFSTQKSMHDEQVLSTLKNNENKESWNLTITSLGKGGTNHLCLQTFLFDQAVVPRQHKLI